MSFILVGLAHHACSCYKNPSLGNKSQSTLLSIYGFFAPFQVCPCTTIASMPPNLKQVHPSFDSFPYHRKYSFPVEQHAISD